MFIFTDSLDSWNKNVNNYKDIHIYIDVIAMLLIGNIKNTKEEKFYKEEMNILRAIAHALPEFFKYLRVSKNNLFFKDGNIKKIFLIIF